MPPIGLSGELAHTYRQRSLSDRGDSNENLSTLRLKANTYIWEPWFARAEAGFTVGTTKIDRDSETSSSDVNGYHGKFSLFPYSRFPTEIYYQRDDSRLENFEQDAGVSNDLLVFLSDFTNTRYGINQLYTTPDGTRFWLRAEDNQFSDEEGTDSSSIVQLGANSWFQSHKLDFDLRLFDVDRIEGEEDNNDIQAVLRHSYRKKGSFSLENILDYNDEDTVFNDGRISNFENLQFTSFSVWTPDAQRPLRLTGNLRLNQASRGVDSESGTTDLENVSLGAIYDLTPRTQVTASTGISTSSNSDGEQDETNFQSVGARYRSRQYDISGFAYSWSPFATITNENDTLVSSQTFDAGVAHDVRKRISLSKASNLSLSLGQTADTRTVSSDAEELNGAKSDERRLTNQGSVRLSRNNSTSNSQISLSVGESREFGEQASRLNLANLQISGTQYFGRFSSLTGNITVQRSEFRDRGQEQEQDSGNRQNTSSSYSIKFNKQRLFGVRRLRFSSEFLKTDREFRTDLDESNPLLAERRADQVWDNRLKYSIGRVELSLVGRAAKRDGQTERSIIARAVRRILR